MNLRKTLVAITAFIAVAALLAAPVQTGAQEAKPDGTSVTVKGKIEYSKQMGGYFIHGEEPGGEFMIMNPNAPVLKKLMKQRKTVSVEGTLKGSEFLTIKKINGLDYRAKAVPAKTKEEVNK